MTGSQGPRIKLKLNKRQQVFVEIFLATGSVEKSEKEAGYRPGVGENLIKCSRPVQHAIEQGRNSRIAKAARG